MGAGFRFPVQITRSMREGSKFTFSLFQKEPSICAYGVVRGGKHQNACTVVFSRPFCISMAAPTTHVCVCRHVHVCVCLCECLKNINKRLRIASFDRAYFIYTYLLHIINFT